MRSVTVACAVGRIYDPGGKNHRPPLDEVSLETLGATAIEYRPGGQWSRPDQLRMSDL